MHRALGAIACLLVLGAAACASRNSEVDSLSATQGLPSTRVDLEAKDWLLNAPDSTVRTAESVTLVVDNDLVSGTAPCNAYNGDFDLGRDNSVDITHVATTRKACEPATMTAEHAYLAALAAVDTVDVNRDDNRMVLSNDNPRVRLSFRSFTTKDHLVGIWKIVNFSNGKALTSPVAGTDPTIKFTDDGRVSIATGCNTAGATWKLEGDHLSTDAQFQTAMGCEPARAAQEAALTNALRNAVRAQASPATLTLFDDDGNIVLVATTETG